MPDYLLPLPIAEPEIDEAGRTQGGGAEPAAPPRYRAAALDTDGDRSISDEEIQSMFNELKD